MSIEDKIFKAQQKADALADSFTENDPILARSEALKNKLVFDQLAKMSNPRVSLVDKLYSMGETKQRIQGIEEQEKAYKINKIADPTRYDNSYVDGKTGEVKKYSDLINYDREIEDYSLLGAVKNAATSGTANLLQGGGKILQSATNGLGMLGEMGLQALDDITSPHDPNRFNSKDYKDIINKWDNNTIGALGVANAIAKPLNEAAKKINYKNLSSTDDIHQAFSEGIWEGTKELGSAIAHTLIGSAPEVAPALFGVVPGLLAGAGSFMARADKERQAKALGVSPDDIMEVSPNMTPEDLIGGAIYGGLNLVDASILKNAVGKGLISKLSDGTIGLSSKADNATKNAFARLRESSPRLDAWLKPQGAGAKAVAWSADKAWKLGKTTGKVGGKVGIAAGLEGGAEMGQTLMEQWANGDLKDRSWDENWKDIKEAGLMGAYVGGSLKAPHAVYQEGKDKFKNVFNNIKETGNKYLKDRKNIASDIGVDTDNLPSIDSKEFDSNKDYYTNLANTLLKTELTDADKATLTEAFNKNENLVTGILKAIYDDNIKTLNYKGKEIEAKAALAQISNDLETRINKAIDEAGENSNELSIDLSNLSALEQGLLQLQYRNPTWLRKFFETGELQNEAEEDIENSDKNNSLNARIDKTVNTLKNVAKQVYKNNKEELEEVSNIIDVIAAHAREGRFRAASVAVTGHNGKESILDYLINLKNLSGNALKEGKEKLKAFQASQNSKKAFYNSIKTDISNSEESSPVIYFNQSNGANNFTKERVIANENGQYALKHLDEEGKETTSIFTNRNDYVTARKEQLQSSGFLVFDSTNANSSIKTINNMLDTITKEDKLRDMVLAKYDKKIANEEKKAKDKVNPEEEIDAETKAIGDELESNAKKQDKEASDKKEESKEESKKEPEKESKEESSNENKELIENSRKAAKDVWDTKNTNEENKNNESDTKDTDNNAINETQDKVEDEIQEDTTNNKGYLNPNSYTNEEKGDINKLKEAFKNKVGFKKWDRTRIDNYFIDFLKLYKSINPNLSKEEFETNISKAFTSKTKETQNLYDELLQGFIQDNYIDSEITEELENSFIGFLDEENKEKKVGKGEGKQKTLERLEEKLKNATDENEESIIKGTIKYIQAYVYPIFSRFKLSKNATSNTLLSNPSYIKEQFIKTLSQFVGDLTSLKSLKNIKIEKKESKINEIKQLYGYINGILDTKYKNISNRLKEIDGTERYDRQGFKVQYLQDGNILLRINNFINFIKNDKDENGKRSQIAESIRLAMFIAAFEQTNNPLFSSYRDNAQLTEDLESVFGIGNIEFHNNIQNDIRQGIFETKLKERIGERILNLLSLEVKKDHALYDNRKRAADELAEYIIGAFIDVGIFENVSVNREDILSNSNGDKSVLNFIKLKDGASKALFSKTITNPKNSTIQEISTYNDSFRLLDAFVNENNLSKEGVREEFSFTPHGEASKLQKTTQGKNIQVSPNTREALEISQNSPFGMSTTFDFLYNLFIDNIGDNGLTLTKEELYKAFTDKAGNVAYFPEVLDDKENTNGEHTVLFDERDTAKGKTITTMNEVDALLGFIELLYEDMKQKNITTPDPVYFKYRISANFREFLQNNGINPQSSKLARFLLIPEEGIGEYVKGKDGMIDHPEADVAYTSIAQSFGHSTDKSSPKSNIEFGKKVFRLIFGEGGIGYEKFKEAVIKSMRSAYTEGHKINFKKIKDITKDELANIDKILGGIELNFEELGHALSALASLENHHKAKVGEKYKSAYLSESDGINNGPAIKLFQYMLDPTYLELLQTAGIDLLNEIDVDEISSYLGGKKTLENEKKINDLYQRVAKVLSDKLIEELDIYSYTDEELVALYKEKNKGATDDRSVKKEIENKRKEYNKKLANIMGIDENLYNSNIMLQKTVEHTMKFLSNSFALDDKGNVTKKGRNNAKPITQVFNYGAGDASQLRNLIDTFMESLPRLAYNAIEKIENKKPLENEELIALNILRSFYGRMENGEFKEADTNIIKGYLENGVITKRYVYENGKKVKKDTKVSLFDNKVEFIGEDSEKRKATNGETGISAILTLRNLFKKAITAALEDIIPKIMNSVFPHVKAQNNLTNSIFNLQLSIVQAIYEHKLKQATNNGERILTVRELEKINDEIQRLLPGIKLSIENGNSRVQSRIEGQLKMVGKERSVDIENSFQMMTGSLQDSSVPNSRKLNGFKVTYGNVGASPNVISIHQEDGSAMMLTTIKVSRKFTDNKRAFLGIHDALMMEASFLRKFGKEYNKIAFELNMKSVALKNNMHIAAQSYHLIEASNTESFTTQTGAIVNKNTMKAHAALNLAHQSLMYLISSINRNFAFHFPINYNNVQNGVRGTSFKYNPEDYHLEDFSKVKDENGNKLKLKDLQIKTAEEHLNDPNVPETEKEYIREFIRLNNLAMQLEEKLIRAKQDKDIENNIIYADESKNKSTATEILGDIDGKGKIQGSLLNDIIKFMNRIIDEANSRNERIYKLMNKQDLKLVKLKEISSIEDLLGMALSEKEIDILEKTYENKKLTQEEINEKVGGVVSTIENLITIHKGKETNTVEGKAIKEGLKEEINKLTNAKNITREFAASYVEAIEGLKITLANRYKGYDRTQNKGLIEKNNQLIDDLAYLNSNRILNDAKAAYNRQNNINNPEEEVTIDNEVKTVSKKEIKENAEELVDDGIIPSDNTLQEASQDIQEQYADTLEEYLGEDITNSSSTDTYEDIPDDIIDEIDDKDQNSKANELGSQQEEDYSSSRDTSGIKNRKILSDDISEAKDTVLEIKNELRQMDKEQGHSLNEEHSKRLTKVLSSILSPFMDAVKGVKVKLEEGHNRNSGGFNPTTNTITMRVMSKAQAFLGWMTREEAYCHEISHSATHFAIRINNGNNKHARQLSALYRIFKEKVTVEDIANALNLKSPEENLRVAKLMYKHMTKYDFITNLEEFNAMGVSSEAMYKVLNNIKYKEKEKETTLYGKLTSLLKDAFDFLFGDGIRFLGKDASLYDALLSLNKKLIRANNKAREQVNANGGYKLAIKETIRNKLDRKGAELIDFSIRGVGKGVSRILTGQSRKYITFRTFREFVSLSTLAIFDPDFRKEFRKAVKDYPLLSYKSTMGSIIEDISTPSVIGRIAQFLQKKSNIIDGKRQFVEKLAGNEIKSLFNQELDKKDSQILGEILLNSDLSSLNMDSFEIADLLSNPDNLKKAISEKEKEIYDVIDKVFDEKTYKCRVGQYKNYIKNRSNALAYYMTTGRATDIFVQRNAYNIVKLMGTTKGPIGADEALIPLVDKYITLLSLDLQPQTMRSKVAEISKNNSNGFNTALQWHNGHKANMLREAYNGKRHLEVKGYKEDITDKTVNIRVGRVKDKEKFAKIGYVPLNDQINTTSHRLLKGHDRCYYVNTFIETDSKFNRTAVRYTKNIHRGTDIKNLLRLDIAEHFESKEQYEREYKAIMKDIYKEMNNVMNDSMTYDIPRNLKGGNVALIPIYSEQGNIQTFDFVMEHSFKSDVLKLDYDLFDNIGKMSAKLYDIAYSKMLNDEIADNLIADFNASYDKKTQFIELSYNAKNAKGEPNYEAREIYKMLPEAFKKKLEEHMGGKILVRDETFVRFFGYRDMDIRNTRFYKDSSNVTLKKIAIYSTELLKKFSKIFKIETVVKNPKVFLGNQVSNFVQCYNHGMSIQDTFKYHIEGIENLKRYIELEKRLEQLKLRESLGIKINENLKKALEQDIEMNPVKKLVDKGFLNTIAEDLDSSSNAYIDRQFENLYNKIGEVSEILQKGVDIAYLSESTEIGKALSTYTKYADFFSRYALYQGLSKQGVHEQRIFEIIMDAFIDYDAPTSKFIKAGNDYGAFMFTRFFTRSQRLLTEHLRKRPVSTTLYLATRWATGDFLGLGSDIYDANVFEKNFEYMLNPLNPLYNIIDASTPGLLNFVPGFGEYISVNRS